MDALQRDLSRLEAWSGLWLLKFHPDKCHVLSFGKEDVMSKLQLFHGQYSFCGHLLDHVEEEKDLGVIIDSQLNFASHIDAKVAKAMAFLGLIRRNFQYLNVHSLLSLYKAFVRPHLEYAQAVWSPSSTAMITKRLRTSRSVPSIWFPSSVGSLTRSSYNGPNSPLWPTEDSAATSSRCSSSTTSMQSPRPSQLPHVTGSGRQLTSHHSTLDFSITGCKSSGMVCLQTAVIQISPLMRSKIGWTNTGA